MISKTAFKIKGISENVNSNHYNQLDYLTKGNAEEQAVVAYSQAKAREQPVLFANTKRLLKPLIFTNSTINVKNLDDWLMRARNFHNLSKKDGLNHKNDARICRTLRIQRCRTVNLVIHFIKPFDQIAPTFC